MADRTESSVNYEERVLVFLDILNTSTLVQQSKTDASIVSTIFGCLESSQQILRRIKEGASSLRLQTGEAEGLSCRLFSDTITLSWPYKSYNSVNYMVSCAELLQYKMWSEAGLFLRGAMVCGDLYDEGSIIFGPALVSAYRLEHGCADWARVLIDESVFNKLSATQVAMAHNEYLRQDDDALSYLDYMRDLFHLSLHEHSTARIEDSQTALRHPIELFRLHKTAVERSVGAALSEDRPDRQKVLNRCESLASYHNDVIDRQSDVILGLADDDLLMRRILNEVNGSTLLGIPEGRSGQFTFPYKRTYTADNPEYVDVMPLLGANVIQIVSGWDDAEDLANKGWDRVLDRLLGQLPQSLLEFKKALHAQRIDA